MSVEFESAVRIAALRDKADAVTGETSDTLAQAVDALITGYGAGGTKITEDWQRPSDWPDLESLGKPEGGTIYLTYDCRDTISGAYPGRMRLMVNGLISLERGRVENGQFTATAVVGQIVTGQYGEDLPADEGDFVVYRLKCSGLWSFTDDNQFTLYLQPCVEVYGTADGGAGSLMEAHSYRGPAQSVKSFVLYGNIFNGFTGTGAANYDYAVERLNMEDWVTGSVRTSLSWSLGNLTYLKKLTVPFDTSAVTNFSYLFSGNMSMEQLDISAMDTSAATTMNGMFTNNKRLRSLDLSHFKTAGVEVFTNMFNGCTSLTDLDFSGLDTSAAAEATINMFNNCYNLTNLKVGKITKNFRFAVAGKLTHESLLNVIAALAETETTQTLTIGAANLAKLSEEEIAAATEKGWTVV